MEAETAMHWTAKSSDAHSGRHAVPMSPARLDHEELARVDLDAGLDVILLAGAGSGRTSANLATWIPTLKEAES